MKNLGSLTFTRLNRDLENFVYICDMRDYGSKEPGYLLSNIIELREKLVLYNRLEDVSKLIKTGPGWGIDIERECRLLIYVAYTMSLIIDGLQGNKLSLQKVIFRLVHQSLWSKFGKHISNGLVDAEPIVFQTCTKIPFTELYKYYEEKIKRNTDA